MPRGNYSYSGDSEQRPFAITEPDSAWTRPSSAEPQEESYGILAKEPDRQSTARRGSQSRRGRSMEDQEEQGSQSRSRAQRGGSRGGAQARSAGGRGQTARRGATTESKRGGQKKSRRGFAAMSPEQQREIARKGGLTVSRNRRHMADIGRIGGEHSHGGRRGRR